VAELADARHSRRRVLRT